MRRQQGIDVPDGSADQALLNRRDLILKALALGGAAAAAAALAPAEALAAEGDIVHVGQLASTGTGSPVFNGRNTGGGPGVEVEAAQHDAIRAFAHGANKSSVYASHSGDGYGVYAIAGRTAVVGRASTAPAIGVYAENYYGGLGLSVVGRTELQRSGVAAAVAGNKSVTVTVPQGVSGESKYLVTMQGNPGTGVFVAYARYFSATQFRVYFNKACTKAAKLAWMVLD
jgi:hypothetical protein